MSLKTQGKHGPTGELLNFFFPERLDFARGGKLTPRTIAAVAHALRSGATREAAAAMAGVTSETLTRWLREGATALGFGPESTAESRNLRRLWEAVAAAEAESENYLLACVQAAIKQAQQSADARVAGDLALKLLERRFPERWGGKARVELSGKVDVAPDVKATAAAASAAVRRLFGGVGPEDVKDVDADLDEPRDAELPPRTT